MASVSVYNMEGAEVGKIELNDAIFGVEVKNHLMHRAVVLQQANSRQGTQAAKNRALVRGGGRKPWRQKGTGHARQGSIRAPQWTGGGVVFAPQPREYSFKMNRQEKRIALFSALTTKVAEEKIVVVDSLDLAEIKTKEMKRVLGNLKAENALVVMGEKKDNVVLSARNLEGVATALTNTINVYDILKYDKLVLTKDAVAKLEEVYING